MRSLYEKIRQTPVTVSVAAMAIIGFLCFQPSSIEIFQSSRPPLTYLLYPIKLVCGSFLHANFFHLIMNLALWVFIGLDMEKKIGSKRFLMITFIAVLAGGSLETIMFGPNFVGLSAACYGLIGLLIWYKLVYKKGVRGAFFGIAFTLGFIIVDTAFNIFASPDQIAYASHIGGIMAGFLSSFGIGKGHKVSRSGRAFRSMVDADIRPVLKIIYDHDEDDGAEAQASFQKSLAHKYVVEIEGQIIGMSGFTKEVDTEHTAWLSFTYISENFRQQGHAYWMMLQLRMVLNVCS